MGLAEKNITDITTVNAENIDKIFDNLTEKERVKALTFIKNLTEDEAKAFNEQIDKYADLVAQIEIDKEL